MTTTTDLILWGFHPKHTPWPIKLTGGRGLKSEQRFREAAGWTCATYAAGTAPEGLRLLADRRA